MSVSTPAQLPIIAYRPLVQGGELLDENLGIFATDYGHENVADGGFEKANLVLAKGFGEVEGWLQSGLMRHIEVYSPAIELIWEGFVNKVSAAIGPLTVEVGPVLNIANKVSVIYQTKSYNTNPPIPGKRMVSSFSGDTNSQGRYGILELYLSGGTGTTADWEQARDSYLEKKAKPEVSNNINLSGSGSEPRVSLELMGYRLIGS